MVNFFSGDLASTAQGYLSNSAPSKGVQIRDSQGLKISNDSGTRNVTLACSGTSTLSLSGSLSVLGSLSVSGSFSPDVIRSDVLQTKTQTNLLISPLGNGCVLTRGKHLSLGGNPSGAAIFEVIAPSQASVSESLLSLGTSDCDDRLEISNASSTNGVFECRIQGSQRSRAATCALDLSGVVYGVLDSTSDECCVKFTASRVDDAPLENMTLFSWTNGRGPRQSTSFMEMVSEDSVCSLVMPNALDRTISLQPLGGSIKCYSLDCSRTLHVAASLSSSLPPGDPDFDLLRISNNDAPVVIVTPVDMTVSGALAVADINLDGDPDFDLLRVGNNGFGLPSPGHTTLTVKRSGAVAHGSLQISGDPGFDLLRVSPRDASAIFSIDQDCDFHLVPVSNFVIENIQAPPTPSTSGRLLWDSLRDVAMVDTGTTIKKIGPDTLDQLALSLIDSSEAVGGASTSGGPPPLTPLSTTVILPADQIKPGTRFTLCVDGSCSRSSSSTLRIAVTVSGVVVYDDICKPFSLAGGAIVDAPWSLELDMTCRTGGQSAEFVCYGECMVPFERGDLPGQEQRVATYDLRASRRSVTLDGTRSHDCVVSVQWGSNSSSNDKTRAATYDLAVCKKL